MQGTIISYIPEEKIKDLIHAFSLFCCNINAMQIFRNLHDMIDNNFLAVFCSHLRLEFENPHIFGIFM